MRNPGSSLQALLDGAHTIGHTQQPGVTADEEHLGGSLLHNLRVVRDHEHSPTGLALLDKTVRQQQPGHPVQTLLGLVKGQQPVRADQDRCQRKTAPLPRGELIGKVPRQPPQLQVIQQIGDNIIGVGDAVPEAHELKMLGNGQCGKEGLLPQVGGHRGALSARARIRHTTEHPHPAVQRLQQSATGAQNRRLTGPINPDQRQDLAGEQIEGRRSADRLIVISDAKISDTHQGLTALLEALDVTRRRFLGSGRAHYVVGRIRSATGYVGTARPATRCGGQSSDHRYYFNTYSFGGPVMPDALRSGPMDWNSVARIPDPHGQTEGARSPSSQAGADWSTTRDPGFNQVMVSTRDLAQIRAIAEAAAQIAQDDGREQDAQTLREVVTRFNQVAGPLDDHYGQVGQWSTTILGRS